MVSTTHSITIPGRYNEIRRACALARETADALGFDEQTQFHIELACDEACTNIIEHAYGGEDRGEIRLEITVTDDALQIALRDAGAPFAPEEVPRPSPLVPGAPLEPGGLGLFLIQQLMDDVSFNFDADGNLLVMTKRRPKREEKGD